MSFKTAAHGPVHQSGEGRASWAWWEGLVQKACRLWQPFKAPEGNTVKGLHLPWTSRGDHTVPQLEHPSKSGGAKSYSLFVTFCGSRHLLGSAGVLQAITTALMSSLPGLTWQHCFYSLSETGEEDVLDPIFQPQSANQTGLWTGPLSPVWPS